MLTRKNVRFLSLKLVLAAVAALAGAGAKSAMAQVVGPRVAQGTYTVTYVRRGTTTNLEERIGPEGSWTVVTSVNGGSGGVNYTFTNKPPGEYYYRTSSRILLYPRPPIYTWTASQETKILVIGPRPANADTFANQMQYDYRVRQGDIDFDGRPDLFIERTSGGTPNNGAVEKAILRRMASGQFNPMVPTAAQAATASSWPVSGIQVEPTDLNLDGFADLQLSGLTSSVGGSDQIVVAAGNASGLPQRVVPMDGKYDKFLEHTQAWISDPDYIIKNSQLIVTYIYEYRLSCQWIFRDDNWEEYVCDYWPYWVGTTYAYDTSWVDPDSYALRNVFNQVINGILQPIVIPGSIDGQTLDAIFFKVFGVPIMWGGFVDPNCDYAYDSVYRLTCVDWAKVFLHMLQQLRRVAIAATDWRYLSILEKAEARLDGLYIRNLDLVRVYNHGYGIFHEGKVHQAAGDIYIGRNNDVGMFWSDDYAIEVGADFSFLSTLVHELTHVFQYRTRGCGVVCIESNHLTTTRTDYIYKPLVPGKDYFSYNVEQQAEMVSDRFRLRMGTEAWLSENRGVRPQELNAVIPF